MMRRSTISWKFFVGLVKDKAAILSKPSASAIIRATTHSPPIPPNESRLSSLLRNDDSSATASALMDRLHRTRNCVVALKCLVVIHNIINRSVLQRQVLSSVFSSKGRSYNYLIKTAAFIDPNDDMSAWVRWYACYLESLLSRSVVRADDQPQRVTSFTNAELIKDVDSLVSSIERICRVPKYPFLDKNNDNNTLLVKEIMSFLYSDYHSLVREVSSRLAELNERLSCLSFGESIELACILERLEDCKGSLSSVYVITRPFIENLWGLVKKLRDTVGVCEVWSSIEKKYFG